MRRGAPMQRGGARGGALHTAALLAPAVARLASSGGAVTAAAISAMLAAHFAGGLPGVRCLAAAPFARRGAWLQPAALLNALGAQLLHGSDTHLYYNMLSFAGKGGQLERALGAPAFAALLALLLPLTAACYVALALTAAALPALAPLGGGPSALRACAVGFSGVIFALKTVIASETAGEEVIGGFRIPTRWAPWAELLLFQLLQPDVSFIGHLAGILAGLLVVAAWRAARAMPAAWLAAAGQQPRRRVVRGGVVN